MTKPDQPGKPDVGDPKKPPLDRDKAAKKRRDDTIAAFHKAKPGGPLAVDTKHGRVDIEAITGGEDKNGASWVDVHLAGTPDGGDPHFRIFNPPTLASDPAGTVLVDGRSYREDPVAAIAEVIAANGGVSRQKERPR